MAAVVNFVTRYTPLNMREYELIDVLSSAITAISEAIDSSNKIWVQTNSPTYVGGEVVIGTVEMV